MGLTLRWSAIMSFDNTKKNGRKCVYNDWVKAFVQIHTFLCWISYFVVCAHRLDYRIVPKALMTQIMLASFYDNVKEVF